MLGAKKLLAATGGLAPLAYVASSSDTTLPSVTMPSGINSGDLIIVVQNVYNDPAPTLAYGTGFTSLDGRLATGSTGIRLAISYKIAAGTEGGTSIGGFMDGNASYENAIVFVYRPDFSISSVTIHDIADEETDFNPAAQTVNASGQAERTIVIGNSWGGAMTQYTLTPDATVSTSGTMNVKMTAQAPYGSDCTVDMPDYGTANTLYSCYLKVS